MVMVEEEKEVEGVLEGTTEPRHPARASRRDIVVNLTEPGCNLDARVIPTDKKKL